MPLPIHIPLYGDEIRREAWYTPAQPPTPHLQVKVQFTPGGVPTVPQWAEVLLEQDVGAARIKISKFNYGCAMFFSDACEVLPKWIDTINDPFEKEGTKKNASKFLLFRRLLSKHICN